MHTFSQPTNDRIRVLWVAILATVTVALLATAAVRAQEAPLDADVETEVVQAEGATPQRNLLAADGLNETSVPLDVNGDWQSVDELVNYAAYTVDAFWRIEFQARGVPYRPIEYFGYYTEAFYWEGCGQITPNNAFYCSTHHAIGYDYSFLKRQWLEHGDFAPVTIIAHEWGHMVQGQANLLNHHLQEAQADCFAGVYAQFAGQQGLLEPGDLEEGAGSLYRGGNPNSPWFGHGTAEERVQAFTVGLYYGVDACLHYYTGISGSGSPVAGFESNQSRVYLPMVFGM